MMTRNLSLVWLCWSSITLSLGQTSTVDSALETKLDSLMGTTMESEHIPGAALIIVKDGKTMLKRGYGYTSLGEEIRQVHPDSTVFRIGSITKTFTAMALLQLVDQGKIDLHQPVNNYLKSFQISSPYKKQVTPEHLINHSAGFDELRGRVVYDSTQVISLADFLRDRLVPLREPGLISSYSSYGIALAGLLVEEVSGQSLEEFMKENIWDPLQMNLTTMQHTEAVEQYASWGYEYRNGANVPMPWEYYHTYPASDINSTVTEMGNYLQMHLSGGQFQGKQVLSQEMADAMKQPVLRVHDHLDAYAYGFYEETAQGFKTVGHGGDMLGYSGYMSLIPELNMGVYVVHHHEGTRLRYQVMDLILGHFAKEEQAYDYTRNDRPTHLDRIAGRYQWTTHCHTCEGGWKPEIHTLELNGDGTYTIFGRTFYQVEPLLYHSTDGERTMGFVEDSDGHIAYMSTGGINMFKKVD